MKYESGTEPSKRRIGLVDTGASVTYGMGVGTLLDLWSGIQGWEFLVSRSYATLFNSATGSLYGWWREKVYSTTRTDEDSNWFRKTLAELFAFNTFSVPVYASIVGIASLASDGFVDWKKVRDGAENIAIISPIIGPTYGWYMNWVRSLFGISSVAEGAYERREF